MRELTKSMTSYTWAMSVFWTQQMFNLLGLGGSGSWDRSTRAFNNVTDATAGEMPETMRAVFRSGDTLQRGAVDLLLAPFSFLNWGGGSRQGHRNGGTRHADGHRGDEYRGDDRGGDGYRGDGYRREGYRDATQGNGDWVDTAARVAQAGADVMQATVDTTARATRRAADAVQQPQQGQYPAAPRSSDPSLGWGPMPR